MTALFLHSPSGAFTVTSATNLNAATPKENLTSDMLGMDCRFTSTGTVIVLDRGGTTEWDTIAFLQSTIVPTATVLIETSTASNFTGAVTVFATATVPLGTVSSSRRKCHFHRITATTHRYVRITFASATGGFDLGRILIGKAVTFDGITTDAERTVDDRADISVFGAYRSVLDRPTLLGWNFGTTWMTDSFYRYTWLPFLQTVGFSRYFLFVPLVEETNNLQADWCYGHVTSKASVEYVGTDTWITKMAMMGIYP